MADLALIAGTVPSNALLPTSAQQLVNFVASYLGINSLDLANVEGILISPTAPTSPASRDMAWLQTNSTSGVPQAIFVYNGGWQQLPVIPQSGAIEPTTPSTYQLFYNTTTGALEFFTGAAWTTAFWPRGATSGRPTSPAVGYVYYDTTIDLLLYWSSAGSWTTVEGSLNEIKIIDGLPPGSVATAWPGWIPHPSLVGTFPIGANATFPLGSSGGRTSFPWSASGEDGQAGSRDTPIISSIVIDGVNASGSVGSGPFTTPSGTVSIMPPWYGVTYIMKNVV